jgi:hypothetical protein
MLNWLVEKDVILRAPSFPPLSPVPRANVGWIDRETQGRILGKIRPDVRLLVEAMMEAAARPGEAVAWKVRDLHEGGIRIERALTRRREVKGTKTGVMSWKVLPEELYGRLKEAARGKLPEAWLFVNKVGKPYPPSQVSWLWHQAAQAAGVNACLNVASRHSAVSQLRGDLEKRSVEELRRKLAHTNSHTGPKHYIRDEREKTK